MGALSAYEYTRHIIKNIFTAVLISLLGLLSVVIVGLLKYEYNQYRPFKELDTVIDKGIYIPLSERTEDGSRAIYKAVKVKNIYTIKRYSVVFDDIDFSQTVGYSKWIWDNWEPRMQSGRWFEGDPGTSKDGDCIEAVIGGNVGDIEVGDILNSNEIYIYFENDIEIEQKTPLKFKIIGIIQPETKVFGNSRYSISYKSYETAYGPVSTDIFTLFVQNEALEKAGINRSVDGDSAIIEYEDDITEQEMDENRKLLNQNGCPQVYDYREFMDYSEDIIRRHLTLYVPLLIMALALIVIIVCCVAGINVNMEIRHHAIYYLLGCSRKKCMGITLMSTAFMLLTSMVMFVFEFIYFGEYASRENINYSTGKELFMAAVVVYILMAGVTMFMYMRALGRRSPMDALRSSRKTV